MLAEQEKQLSFVKDFPILREYRQYTGFLVVKDSGVFSGFSLASLWDSATLGSPQDKQQQDQFFPHTPQAVCIELSHEPHIRGNSCQNEFLLWKKSFFHCQPVPSEHRGSVICRCNLSSASRRCPSCHACRMQGLHHSVCWPPCACLPGGKEGERMGKPAMMIFF